jgi:DNA-binding NtrC family response regulator
MPKKRVMLVDFPTALRFVRVLLANSGYEVMSSEGGSEAIQSIKAEKPDVVLTHLKSGLLENPVSFGQLTGLGTPVIACGIDSSTADDALQQGARCFIVEPFNFDELLAQIRKATSQD